MTPFREACLQMDVRGKLGREERLVQEACERRGIAVTVFPAKRLHRRQLKLGLDAFVAGTMDVMLGAMKQLGVPVPLPDDYPECLEPWFRRKVRKSMLGAVLDRFDSHVCDPLFIKPAGRTKCFTGFVFTSSDDAYPVGHISRQEPVWCAEVVEWVSEFRVYVIGGEVVGMDRYGGDASILPSAGSIREAVAEYRRSGLAPAAYGIDFGVLASGETALVEANDGFSLGAYQIESEPYTELLFTRWRELLSQIPAAEQETG